MIGLSDQNMATNPQCLKIGKITLDIVLPYSACVLHP